jgi:hypothetical protein
MVEGEEEYGIACSAFGDLVEVDGSVDCLKHHCISI